jgi:hypothetical protein
MRFAEEKTLQIACSVDIRRLLLQWDDSRDRQAITFHRTARRRWDKQ